MRNLVLPLPSCCRLGVAAVLAALVVTGCARDGGSSALGSAPSAVAAPDTPIPQELASEFPAFQLHEWTVADGLSTPVQGIAQTADGYLWLTTSHGLFRFDGVRFAAFTTETVPPFSDDDFISVYAARNGDLWVGARGTQTYRLREGEWQALDARSAIGDHWVQGFAEDADGTLWISGTGDRVGRLVDGAWTPVADRTRNVWTPLVADAAGTVWTYLPRTAAPGQPVARLRSGIVARWNGDRFIPPGDDRQRIGFEATTNGPLFHLPTDTVENGRQRIDLTDGTGRRVGWFSQGDVPCRRAWWTGAATSGWNQRRMMRT